MRALFDKIVRHLRSWRYARLRKQLTRTDVSIISSNCVGTLCSHDLHLPFLSPTVNCVILPKDFIRFVSNLEYYLSVDVRMSEEEKGPGYHYGYVGDIPIRFMHIKYKDEPRKKWNIRRKRVNLSNLVVVMTEKDGCTYDDLVAFDQLPFKRKVVITSKEYPEIKSAFAIQNCVDKQTGQVGYLFDYPHRWSLDRYFEKLDIVKFINTGEIRRMSIL